MMSHDIWLYDQDANCLSPPASRAMTLPVSDLNAAGSPNPAGVTMLAGVAARYMEDDPARPYAPPGNVRWANTATVFKDDGSGSAPFGTGGGNWTADAMLDFAGVFFTNPGDFEWTDTSANGIQPDYSVHHLTVDTLTWPPPPCIAQDGSMNTRTYAREKSVQWVVVRPFDTADPACSGGSECFILPVLPAGWPRSGVAAYKRDGFEQLVGSGAACTVDSQCNGGLGEVCRDVDQGGPGTGVCAIDDGTNYITQANYWWSEIFRLGLMSAFDFDDFAFDSNVTYRTEQSSNELDWTN
jgi:hypothetical protein